MNRQIYLILRTLSVVSILTITFLSHAKLTAGGAFVSSQANQSASTTPQSKELAEASDLTSKVLKLYGERKYEEALEPAKRALQIREKALRADDQLVRSAQVNLAEVYIALRKYRDAESPLERALKSYRAASPDDVRLADLLERKAIVQYALGDSGEAESAYEESLRIKEKVFRADSPKTAHPLLMLAEFHQFAGNDEKAATYYKRLISVREKASGPDQNEQLIDAISRYACLLGKLKKAEEAEKWQARLSALQNKDSLSGSPPDGDSINAFLQGGVLNGKAITLSKPTYPPEARNAGVSGTVVVQVWIDEAGNVFRACAVAGASQLRRAAELASYRSKFAPTQLSGMPIKVTGLITYNFVVR